MFCVYWERVCFRVSTRSAKLLEPRDDSTTAKPGIEGPRDYCGWGVKDVTISMREGGRRSEAAMVFFKLVFLGSDENSCVDALTSWTIPFCTLMVPNHSVSSCSALMY